MPLNLRKQLSLVQALMWIVGSTLFTTGFAYQGLKFYLKWQRDKAFDPRYSIVSILQTGPQKEAVSTTYLAELLGLSSDKLQSIYYFNPKKAEERLLRSPIIKDAHIKLIKPQTLYVDYTVRRPIAWLYDYENTAIDEEGFLFPVSPFFSPKNLPEVYFGLPPFGSVYDQEKMTWNTRLEGRQVQLALDLLMIVSSSTYRDILNVQRVDVSQAFAESFGQREVVLKTEDHIFLRQDGKEVMFTCPRLLRFSTKNYPQELGNYLKLRQQLLEQEQKNCTWPENEKTVVRFPVKIIDFRIPNLAFIEENR